MSELPGVSIVIPHYNHAQFVAPRLRVHWRRIILDVRS